MDDLRPLVDDPHGSPLGRAMLTSARDDAPPPHARARAARRLGVAAVLAVGAGTGSEAGALVIAGKLAAVLLALGGVVGLAMWQSPSTPDRSAPRSVAPPSPGNDDIPSSASSHVPSDVPVVEPSVAKPPAAMLPVETPPPSRTRAPSRPSPRATSRQVSPRAPSDAAAVPAITPATPAGPVVPEPAPAAALPDEPAARTEVAPPEIRTTDDIAAGPSRLAAQVALVDRARAGLRAGDYPAALAALAEYHQRFANGDLDAEADMVMIEVLIAQREIQRARALGIQFLARFPRSPLVQRVHSLLDRLSN